VPGADHDCPLRILCTEIGRICQGFLAHIGKHSLLRGGQNKIVNDFC